MEQVSLRDFCEEARSLIQSGEPGKAIHITRHILRHYPRHLASYRLLGQALLAAGNDEEATRQFRRVLSADPEDIASRVRLASIYESSGDLDKAIWQLQRAVELSPGDSELRAQLGRLINARPEGDTSEHPEITRTALGRIYARRGLFAKAVQEFKAALTQEPARLDVQIALSEVLWRAGRQLEAAEASHRILEKLPNALKANLIIGALWLENNQPDEARHYLRLAQALDPDNIAAQSLFGAESPLPPLTTRIEPLGEDETGSIQLEPSPIELAKGTPDFQTPEPAIDWMGQLHAEGATPMSDEERPEEEFELPDWLKGVGDDLLEEKEDQPAAPSPSERETTEGDKPPDWLRKLVARTEETSIPDEPIPAEPGDEPDWLQELRPEVSEETPPESDTPDWLASITDGHPPEGIQPESAPSPVEPAPTETAPEARQPDRLEEPEESHEPDEGLALWEQILAEEGVDLEAAEEAPPPEAAGMTAEEWLRSTADWAGEPSPPAAEPPPVEEPEMPTAPVAETEAGEAGLPEWLKELEEAETPPPEPDLEEAEMPARPALLEPLSDVVEESDIPEWLREITAGEPIPPERAEPVSAAAPAIPEAEVDETALPDWLRDFEEPIAEEKKPEIELVSPEAPLESTAAADEGRALWEQILAEEGIDLEAADEAPPPEAAGMTAEEWLRSTADLAREPLPPAAEPPPIEEPEAPATPMAEMEEEETQLAVDMEVEAQEAPDRLPEAKEPALAAAKLDEAELPDWLRQVAAGETVPAEEGEPPEPTAKTELPDWLRELQEPATETGAVSEAPEEEAEEAVEVEVDEAELPDWLREPAAKAAESLEPDVGPPAEMPEWLTELEAEEILLAETDFEEPIELETGEMPEWLGEIMAGETPLAEEWAAEPATAETQQEQIPEWLRDFREEEEVAAEPTLEAEELEAPPEAEVQPAYIEQAELPDWLMRLREGVPEAEAPEPAEAPPTVEVEAAPPEAPVEVEAAPIGEVPAVAEMAQAEEAGPDWLGELVRAEERLTEPEAVEEEKVPVEPVVPTPEEGVEIAEPELAPIAAAEAEPEPAEPVGTRELKALRIEDLPKDPPERLSMARAALNAGDWQEALLIYETLVGASELLDSVIDNLQAGVRRHPDEAAGYQLLGDAYMKDGRLHDALQAYRTALTRL